MPTTVNRILNNSNYSPPRITPKVVMTNTGIQSFLQKSSTTHDQILNKKYDIKNGRKCRYIGSVTITSYKVTKEPNSSKSKHRFRVVINMIIGIIGGFAIFKLREDYRHLKSSEKEINRLQESRELIKSFQSKCTADDIQTRLNLKKLNAVYDAQINIFSRIRRKSNLSIAMLVALTAATVLTIVGASLAMYPLFALGAVSVGIFGGGLLLKWIFDAADKGHDKDAMLMQKNIRELRAIM